MISLLLTLILPFYSFTSCAASEKNVFARVMFDDVYLYRAPIENDNAENIYFEIPKTYFVELTQSCNDMFYSGIYYGIQGYIKKECVQAIAGTPASAFMENIHFRVYAELSRDLRSEPNTSSGSSSQIAYIPNLSRNLTYYGKVFGETLIDGRTNVWYYCKYSADKDYFGYVYSDFCDELTSPLPINTEDVTYISNPTFQENEQETQSIPLNNNVVPIIIGILCVPALIFVLMIIKGKNILTKEKKISGEIKEY